VAAKKPLAQRVKTDRGLLKRALSDPGLRRQLPTGLLKAPQRKARALNVRLNAPITAGSTMTERDLARAANASGAVQFGPQEQALGQQLGASQQAETSTGNYYDQYLQRLAQNQADVASQQQQAASQLQGIGQGITGLAASDLAGVQNRAVASAQARGATAGDLTGMASNAAATRQALVGSFQAQQAQQGASAQGYAGSLANVVAPAQKIAALGQAATRTGKVRSDITALAAQKGAANVQYRTAARAEEAKNVLARQTLTGNVEAKAATVAESAKKRRSQEAQTAARLTSQERQEQARLDAQARQGALNRADRDKLAALNAKDKAAKGRGPDWRTGEQAGTAMTQLNTLKSLAQSAKAGAPFQKGHKPQTPLGRHGAAAKIKGFGPVAGKLKDPVLITAALDAVYDQHLSPATVKALIASGYKPSQVMRTLGVPTRTGYKPTGLGQRPTATLKRQ